MSILVFFEIRGNPRDILILGPGTFFRLLISGFVIISGIFWPFWDYPDLLSCFYRKSLRYPERPESENSVFRKDMVRSGVSWAPSRLNVFEHLFELSGGKLNMLQSTEELLTTTDLLRTNKRVSNKIAPVGQPKIQSNKNIKATKSNPAHKNQNRKPIN